MTAHSPNIDSKVLIPLRSETPSCPIGKAVMKASKRRMSFRFAFHPREAGTYREYSCQTSIAGRFKIDAAYVQGL
jgi:hypothetical protein